MCMRAAEYVSALNPRSAPRDAMVETREAGCHTATPCGAWRLPGARCHQSPGRSRHHFSDTALNTPSSCTSVHSLSGLYSFIAPAIREVFSPRLR
jgi:hypothetical protein